LTNRRAVAVGGVRLSSRSTLLRMVSVRLLRRRNTVASEMSRKVN